MSSNSDDLPISVERGFGRTLQTPMQFIDSVGDFVVKCFEGLPTGQAVAAERSLLQPHAPSARSNYQSFPTVGMSAFIEIAADQQQIPVDVPTYRVRRLDPPVRSPLTRNPAIPQFVFENAEGIVEYSGDVSAAEILIDVASAFPNRHVLVVSTHRKELQRLCSRVRELAPCLSAIDVSGGRVPYGFGADDESIAPHQLVFSTISQASSLGETVGRDIAQFPIVIDTQAARAVDLMRHSLVCAADSAFRLFGLYCLKSPMAEDANRYLMLAPFFADLLKQTHNSLRKVVAQAALHGLPMPALASGLAWFDMMRTGRSTANMIQAQRDFFGAHGFERLDQPGAKGLHGPWGGHMV